MTRPQTLHGSTARIKTGCGKLYLTENISEEYSEVFTKLGKSGGCAAAFLDGIGRLISLGSNKILTREIIIHAFTGIRCPSPMWNGDTQVLSCLDGIAKLLTPEATPCGTESSVSSE